MADLIIIAYPELATAEAARAKLMQLQKEYLIELGDAVVAERQADGTVKLHQLINTTAAGAAGGAMWGTLIGLLFLNPLLGAALGAGAGALSGRFNDIGLDDKMMKDLAQSFKPGTSALFVLIRKATADKVLDALKDFAGRGKVFKTSLNKDDEQALREALEKPVPAAARAASS